MSNLTKKTMNKKGVRVFNSRIHTTLSVEMAAKSLEEQLRQALAGKEQIKTDMSSMQYTERKQGVLPQYDIRTDRWEIALQASDKVSKSNAAKRNLEDHPELYEHNEDGSLKMDANGQPIMINTGGQA